MFSRQMRQLPGAIHRSRHPGRQKAAHYRQAGHLTAILPCRAARLPGLQTHKRRKRHRHLRLLKTKTSGEEVYRPGLPCMARPWEGMRFWVAPGNPGAQSDANGNFRSDVTITGAWSAGTHTLTARDASNYSTNNSVSVTIVQPGQ